MARSGKSVNETIECRGIGAGEASERLLQQSAADYRAVGVGANRFQLARTFRPTWAVAVGCALTPVLVGLAFFFVRRTETWDATVEEDHRVVRVRIAGTVLPRVLLAIRQAVQQGPAPASAAPPPGLVADPVATPGALVTAMPVEVPTDPARLVAAPTPGGPGGWSAWQSPTVANPAVVAPAPPDVPGSPSGPASPVVMTTPVPRSVEPAPASSLPDALAAPAAEAPRSDVPPPVDPPLSAEAGLVLCFDTGERHRVAPEMLIGRDPAPGDPSDPAPALVAVSDPDFSVSKTHLLVRSAGRGVVVVDRGSVNGTAVEDVQGLLTPVTEGDEVHAGVGATVRFGARSFLVAEESP